MNKLLCLLTALISLGASAGEHITATNCEIFIDKLTLSYGSHASAIIKPGSVRFSVSG